MPNWCYTGINIKCSSEEEAEYLYKKIQKWTSVNYCCNDFGLNWLGNIVGNSGVGKIKDGRSSVDCRGELIYLDLNDNEVIVETETAWKPMLQMWKRICDKYLVEGYGIEYSAEEPGLGLYVTNIKSVIEEEPHFEYEPVE